MSSPIIPVNQVFNSYSLTIPIPKSYIEHVTLNRFHRNIISALEDLNRYQVYPSIYKRLEHNLKASKLFIDFTTENATNLPKETKDFFKKYTQWLEEIYIQVFALKNLTEEKI